MKLKDSNKKFIIFSLIFVIIYVFAAAVPLGSDVYFLPVWVRSIVPDSAQRELAGIIGERAADIRLDAAQFENASPKAFMAGNRFGYFTDDGTLLRSSVITDRVSLSSKMWSVYPENSVSAPIYAPDGTQRTAINAAGFVHIDDDRIYLFEPGGCTVARYTEEGMQQWRYAHTAPITAFQSSPAGAVIGYSDGKLVCLTDTGSVRFDFYPGGSNYQVILGAALSEDGTLAACVCGIDRQRALLIRAEETRYKIVQHVYLKGNLRRQVFVDFDTDGEHAVFECADGIGVFNCRRFSSNIMPIAGSITSNGLAPYKNIMAVLTQTEHAAALSIIEKPIHLIGTTTFPSRNTFLIQDREKLFIVTDSHLTRIDIKGVY